MPNAKNTSVWDKVGDWLKSQVPDDPDAGLTPEQKAANLRKLAPRGTYPVEPGPANGTPHFVRPDDGSGY